MHPKECNFMVFNNNSDKSIGKNIKFKLYDDFIPNCDSIKFLGITFDIGLVFSNHINDIKKKCINRLNVIKMLSNKKWKLSKITLISIFKALIRSIIDYSSVVIPFISKGLLKTTQSIQNTAIKCIFELNYLTSTEEVIKISGVEPIKERAETLNGKYLQNCIKFNNPLIIELIDQYIAGNKQFNNTTFLCRYKNVLTHSGN
jgi:hypothetical protein